MPPILTAVKGSYETLGPTDVCKIPGPMGIPIPNPFPGANMPMMWSGLATKVFASMMPVVKKSSKGPMCKVHGGPLGPLIQGQPLGMGPGECVLPLAVFVTVEGEAPCVDGALYTMNGKNTPPGQAAKGDKKVDVT